VLDVVDPAGRVARPAAREPLDELVVRGFERHGRVELDAEVLEGVVEGLGLGLVAGEAVEQPGVGVVEVGLRHLDDDLVRDQLAAVVKVLDLLAEFGAGLYLGADDVPGRDVLRSGLLREALRLRALACPLRAQKNDLHRFFKNPS
jgi:hypothetical protein